MSNSQLHVRERVQASLRVSTRVKTPAVALIRSCNHSSTVGEQGGGYGGAGHYEELLLQKNLSFT